MAIMVADVNSSVGPISVISTPFRLTPEGNRRQVVYNPLRENADGSYSMDFDNLALRIAGNQLINDLYQKAKVADQRYLFF